jgi:hypothetical protein
MRWVLRVALLFSSVVLCLFAVEGCYRLRGARPFPKVTERSKFWQYDSELGWKNRPGQSGIHEMPDFRVHVATNGRGLRDDEHDYARKGRRKRMLVLGDSFVWGYGVEKKDRFTERIERRSGIEVINAGVSGYGTDQELLWLRSEGMKYDFDHLLLVFCGDDLAQNHLTRVFYVYEKPRFVLEDGRPVLTNVPVPEAPATARFAHWIRCRSALFHVLTEARPPRVPEEEASAEFPLTRALLGEMRDLAQRKGADMTIVIAARRWWCSPAGASIEQFVETLRADGYRVLDMEVAPDFDPPRMIMPVNGHWNPIGHAFVAKMLLEHGGFTK